MIVNEFPKVELIKNKENVGFSKAVNIGLNIMNGDYVCILNPDTLVSDNTFSILSKLLHYNRKSI